MATEQSSQVPEGVERLVLVRQPGRGWEVADNPHVATVSDVEDLGALVCRVDAEAAMERALLDALHTAGLVNAEEVEADFGDIVSALKTIRAAAVEEFKAKRNCPKHGDVCGRPNWTGYCPWRVQQVEDRIPDYDNALSLSERRADELEARTEKAERERDAAVEEERERGKLILSDKGVAGLLDPDSREEEQERLESALRRIEYAAQELTGRPVELVLRAALDQEDSDA